jgi:hypothetical protein
MRKICFWITGCLMLSSGLFAADITSYNSYNLTKIGASYDNDDFDRTGDYQPIRFNGSKVGTTEILILASSHGTGDSDTDKAAKTRGGGWSDPYYSGDNDKACEIWFRQVTSSNVGDIGEVDSNNASGSLAILVYDGLLSFGNMTDEKYTSAHRMEIDGSGDGPAWLVVAGADNDTSDGGNADEYYGRTGDKTWVYLTTDKTFSDSDSDKCRGAVIMIELEDEGGGVVNTLPEFTVDPVVKANVAVGELYDRSLLDTATDADGDALVWSIVSGPSWLSMTSDRRCGGTPIESDAGLNQWVVRVTDSLGASDEATLQVTVTNPDPDPDAPVNLATAANYATDSGDLQAGKEIGYIHDGDIATPTARGGDDFWVEYEFDGTYQLSSARVYGDTGGTWNSASWTLQAWDGSAYVDVFTSSPCFGDQWFEKTVDVTTTKAKVIVHQGENGAEVFEVQVFGKKIDLPADPFPNWVEEHDVIGGPTGDDDGDGINNLLEYALDGDPQVPDNEKPKVVKNGDKLEYSFKKRKGDSKLRYEVKTRSSLTAGDWQAVGTDEQLVTEGSEFDEVKHEIPETGTTTFIRLDVTVE